MVPPPSLPALRLTLGSFALVAASSLGCAATPTAAAPTPSSPTSSEPGAPPSAPATKHVVNELRRSDVKETIARGVGYFLHDNVTVEPAMQGDRFRGFRIEAVAPSWNVDLRVGDVVTRVNGMTIDRPEQAHAVLTSLEKAKSLRVDYERDGKAQVLELPIVDD